MRELIIEQLLLSPCRHVPVVGKHLPDRYRQQRLYHVIIYVASKPNVINP